MVTKHDWEFPTRVFLLGSRFETDFAKDSSGGMWGTKKYFDVAGLEPRSAQDLAEKLRGMAWGESLELRRTPVVQ